MEEKTPDSSGVSEGPRMDPPVLLSDAIRRLNISGCIVCSRGGHTGHQLYTVIANVITRAKGMACKDHLSGFIRPKDLKRSK